MIKLVRKLLEDKQMKTGIPASFEITESLRETLNLIFYSFSEADKRLFRLSLGFLVALFKTGKKKKKKPVILYISQYKLIGSEKPHSPKHLASLNLTL